MGLEAKGDDSLGLEDIPSETLGILENVAHASSSSPLTPRDRLRYIRLLFENRYHPSEKFAKLPLSIDELAKAYKVLEYIRENATEWPGHMTEQDVEQLQEFCHLGIMYSLMGIDDEDPKVKKLKSQGPPPHLADNIGNINSMYALKEIGDEGTAISQSGYLLKVANNDPSATFPSFRRARIKQNDSLRTPGFFGTKPTEIILKECDTKRGNILACIVLTQSDLTDQFPKYSIPTGEGNEESGLMELWKGDRIASRFRLMRQLNGNFVQEFYRKVPKRG